MSRHISTHTSAAKQKPRLTYRLLGVGPSDEMSTLLHESEAYGRSITNLPSLPKTGKKDKAAASRSTSAKVMLGWATFAALSATGLVQNRARADVTWAGGTSQDWNTTAN